MLQQMIRRAVLGYERRIHSPATIQRYAAVVRRLLPRIKRDDVEQNQRERLRRLIHHVHDHAPFYRQRFDDHGIDPDDIRDLDDLPRLPLTSSDDLRNSEPLRCVPESEIGAVFSSAGTTGEPKRIEYSHDDLQMLTNTGALGMRLSQPGRMVAAMLLPLGHGLWIGWRQVLAQIERAGGIALPLGPGEPAVTLRWLRRYPPNVIMAAPSFMSRLTEALRQDEGPPLPVRRIILGAERLSAERQRRIAETWGAEVHNAYATTELGVGLSISPPNELPVYFNELHLLLEIVDPETGEPVDEGEEGELVFTTLTRRAMPVVRYRSGDRARWVGTAPGLPFRLVEFLGRRDEILVIAGLNISARALADMAAEAADGSPRVAVEVDQHEDRDVLRLRTEATLDESALRRRIFEQYPLLREHIDHGTAALELEPGADLNEQLKALAIHDRRR